MKTPLDEALETARRDKSQANFFYDAFLNSDLFMPVHLHGEEAGSWKQVGVKDRFHPLFLSQGEMKVVPAFNQLERLRAWAGDRALDFIALRCHLLLRVLGKEVAVALNPGTPWSFVFSPEVLGQLRAAMKPIRPS